MFHFVINKKHGNFIEIVKIIKTIFQEDFNMNYQGGMFVEKPKNE